MTPKPQWFDSVMKLIVEGHECIINIEEVDEYHTKVIQTISTLLETSYQQGVEDMRRKCVEKVVKHFVHNKFKSQPLQHEDVTNLIKNVK